MPGESETAWANRATWSRILFILGILVYCAVVWYFEWRDIRDEVFGADVLLVLAAIGLITAATWLRVFKWRYALGTGQHAVGLFFMSNTTGNFTPGRLGEFAPMVLRGHRTPRVGAWILYDRIVEILLTIGFGLAGVATLSLLSGPHFFLLGITAIIGVAGGSYLFTHRRLFDVMATRLEEGGRLQSFALFFYQVSASFWTSFGIAGLFIGRAAWNGGNSNNS